MSLLGIGLMVCLSTGCASLGKTDGEPEGHPVWRALDLRPEFTVDTAWERVLATIREEYTIEVLKKEEWFFQTEWLGIDGGAEPLQTRISGKLRPEARRLEVIAEASYLKDGSWAPMERAGIFDEIFRQICISVGR